MSADPRLAAVFTHIDTQRDRFVARLIDYVRHPSISAHNVGIREVAEILVGMLTGLGLDTRLIPTAGHPMVVARWLQGARRADGAALRPLRRAAARPARSLDQPAIRADDPRRPHFRARGRRQQRPASRADPGDRVAPESARRPALQRHPAARRRGGSRQPAHRGLRARSPRPAARPISRSRRMARCIPRAGRRIKFGSRGVVNFELRARHANRDVHSGNFGGVVPNPLWTLVHLLATMKNERGEITIEGFHDDIVPPTARGTGGRRAAAARSRRGESARSGSTASMCRPSATTTNGCASARR